MPVIPSLDKAVQLGINFTPMVPGAAVGATKSIGKAIMDSSGLMPSAPVPIPLIPAGVAVSTVLLVIEFIKKEFLIQQQKTVATLINTYQTLYNQAVADREKAETKLYNDLIKAQEEYIIRKKEIEDEISFLEDENKRLEKWRDEQMGLYRATLFEYASNAKAAKDAGNIEEADMWEERIDGLNPWLEEILVSVVDILMNKIKIMSLEREYKKVVPPTEINLQKKWVPMSEEWASLFDVPVPYYPDLPTRPSVPSPPPEVPEPCIRREARKQFAKWLVTPMVPPIGNATAAVLECIRAMAAPLPPPIAAGMESQATSLINRMGMVI